MSNANMNSHPAVGQQPMPSSAWDIRHMQPPPPTVAVSTTYGCSLHHLRLQPPPPTVAGWSALVLASTQRCSASRSYRATDSGAFRQRATSGGRRGASHLGSTHGQRSCSAWALHGARWRARAGPHDRGRPGQAAAARRSLDKLLSHHLTLVDLAPHVLPDAILAEGVRAAREHGRLGGRRLAHADWTGDLSSRAEPVSGGRQAGPPGASGSGGGGRGRGGPCRC